MSWFNKNKQRKVTPSEGISNAIEIVAHKEAKAEVLAEARQVNQKLNDLLVENGFTLKIYLAAGGTHPPKTKRNK